ncbi:MAG: hypothetical protein ACRBG0_22575 [Lewinella sp.]|uniref:hypothetical protein n=1 Tax=Lewinella sp. TaxID=2004506 RepID=UPI003D6A92B7
MKSKINQLTGCLLVLFAFIALSTSLQAQTVIGGTTPDASAMLDVQSTDRGVLIPRLTTIQRDAVASPATGLMVYNTDESCIQINLGTPGTPDWQCLTAGAATDVDEWVDGDTIGIAGLVYARQAMANGDTVVVTDNGRMGIGISNPFEELTIYGSGTDGTVVHTVNNNSNSWAGLAVGNDISQDNGYFYNAGSNWSNALLRNKIVVEGTASSDGILLTTQFNNIEFQTNGSSSAAEMTLLPNGHLGIGLTTPSNRLHVADTADPLRLEGLQSGTGDVLVADATGVVKTMTAAALGASSEPWFGTDDNMGATDNTEDIYTMGNVGIGTSAPNTTMEILSDQSGASSHPYRNGFMLKSEAGNVGGRIGIWQAANTAMAPPQLILYSGNGSLDTPTAKKNGDWLGAMTTTSFDGTDWVNSASIRVYAAEDFTSTNSGTQMVFNTTLNGAHIELERMRIDEAGNVGIGTTSVSGKLHVTGSLDGNVSGRFENTSATAFGLNVSNPNNTTTNYLAHFLSGATSRMLILNNGNVGINTINPTEKLHVDGNILATGTITPDYVFQQYYEGTSTLKEDYRMMSLEEIEAFTREHKHLPGVPSALEVEEKGGIVLNKQSEVQLEKIEELYLHTIEQNKQIKALEEENAGLKERLERIEKLLLDDKE